MLEDLQQQKTVKVISEMWLFFNLLLGMPKRILGKPSRARYSSNKSWKPLSSRLERWWWRRSPTWVLLGGGAGGSLRTRWRRRRGRGWRRGTWSPTTSDISEGRWFAKIMQSNYLQRVYQSHITIHLLLQRHPHRHATSNMHCNV